MSGVEDGLIAVGGSGILGTVFSLFLIQHRQDVKDIKERMDKMTKAVDRQTDVIASQQQKNEIESYLDKLFADRENKNRDSMRSFHNE